MQKKMKRFVPVVVILAIITATIYYLYRTAKDVDGSLTASGTVETVEVVIAIEVNGQISEILVNEGDYVQQDEILILFEDEILRAQYIQAKAVLHQAQANYQLIAAQPLEEGRQVAISSAELDLLIAQQNLQDLIENVDLARAHLQQEIENTEQALEDLLDPDLQQAIALEAVTIAQKAVDESAKLVRNLTTTASQADIDAAEANVVLAKDALEKAEKDFKPYENKPEDNLTRAEYQARLAKAQQTYDAAVRLYNSISGTANQVDIDLAKANLETAEAQLKQAQRELERVEDGPSEADIALLKAKIEAARRDFEALKIGPNPDDLVMAEAQIKRAEANLALAQADTINEQLEMAQSQVDSAQAALDIIQTQLDKLIITAPINGIVLYQTVEVGEVVKPGTAALTLGKLDQLTITVYIPEDRYGVIQLGDFVHVTVDSFPNETFNATVIRIADRAEFTPRNVQTAEGRQTTVFAVELTVKDPDGKLKPGMPADVTFLNHFSK